MYLFAKKINYKIYLLQYWEIQEIQQFWQKLPEFPVADVISFIFPQIPLQFSGILTESQNFKWNT